MAHTQNATILRHIRNLLVTQTARASSDSVLLRRFSGQHDEQAFAALLHRHGGLVWGVCRHILRNEHDAEDAFQATFLVLARRAGAVRKGESLASWLYGVAYRVAVRARKRAAQRDWVERQAASRHSEPQGDVAECELRALVNDELQRLPEKQRCAFILCCLQGKSRKEAAAELEWNEGTLASRLDRARALMRKRLGKRGVVVPALAAGALFQDVCVAAPPGVTGITFQAGILVAAGKPSGSTGVSSSAITRAEATVRAMFLTKACWALGVLLTAGLLAGTAGLFAGQRIVEDASPQARTDQPTQSKPDTVSEKAERTDRFGDPLPVEAIARLGTVRLRHASLGLGRLLFTPDGKTLISQGSDGARTWDVGTGKQRQFVPYRGEYALDPPFGLRTARLSRWVAAFSADGNVFAMGTKSGVRLFSLDTARQIGTVGQDPHSSICLSSNAKLLATEDRKAHELTLWDATAARPLRTWTVENLAVRGMIFTPEDKTLITAAVFRTGKHSIQFWNAASGTEKRRIDTGPWIPKVIDVSPDGRFLAAVGNEGRDVIHTIRIWNMASGRQLCELTPRPKPRRWGVKAFAFASDGKTIYADGLDGSLRAWDPTTGKELARIGQDIGDHDALAVSADGRELALCQSSVIRLLDIKTGKDRFENRGHEWTIIVTAARDKLVTADYHRAIIWDPKTATEVQRFEAAEGRFPNIKVLGDGRTLLRFELDGEAEVLRTWNLLTGKELRRIKIPGGNVDVSPDGKIVALAKVEQIRMVDTSTGKVVQELRYDGQGWSNAHFTAAGRSFFVTDWDQNVYRWDLATGRRQLKFSFVDDLQPPQERLPFGAAASPDGAYIAFVTQTGLIAIHDFNTGRRVRKRAQFPDSMMTVTFSPDGRTVACGGNYDGIVRLVEVATGGERRPLVGHQGGITSLAFSPGGRTLISGSYDTTALVWDLTGLRTATGGAKPITPPEIATCWEDLARPAATRAYAAMRRLWAAPVQAIPYLKERLRPTAPPDKERVARLLADLSSDQFTVRKDASDALMKLGELASPACRKALEGQLPLEARRRIEAILESKCTTGIVPPETVCVPCVRWKSWRWPAGLKLAASWKRSRAERRKPG
jgi:RNA polymerase sigma factor (sigma-70 family)